MKHSVMCFWLVLLHSGLECAVCQWTSSWSENTAVKKLFEFVSLFLWQLSDHLKWHKPAGNTDICVMVQHNNSYKNDLRRSIRYFYLWLDQGRFHGFCSWLQSFLVNPDSHPHVLVPDPVPFHVQSPSQDLTYGLGHVPDLTQTLVGLGQHGGLWFAQCFHSAPSEAATEECCPAGRCSTSQSTPNTQLAYRQTVTLREQKGYTKHRKEKHHSSTTSRKRVSDIREYQKGFEWK